MTRYIKIDEWEKYFDKMMTGCPLPKKTIAKIKQTWVDEMPTADVVEVVRCSDCEYRGDEIACPIEGNDLHHISDYDYCSWGELKGGDAEMSPQTIHMKQSPSDGADLISRADAIKAIESRQTEQWIDADIDYNNGLESAVAEIKALPSADRPSGEWQSSIDDWKVCSNCNKGYASRGVGLYNYCPACGSKMIEGEKDEWD